MPKFLWIVVLSFSTWSLAQQTGVAPAKEIPTEPEQAVAVTPLAEDKDIAHRIGEILDATGWYQHTKVSVKDGVVFLDGLSGNEDQRVWARNLAAKTQDVVAVVNRIQVDTTPDWSFRPAYEELRRLAYRFMSALPLILLALIVIPVAWLLAKMVYRYSRYFFSKRFHSPLLADIVAKAAALPTVLIGVYIILQVAGLTGIALSLLGGAGVVGIVLGFAFRDIAENFLASLLLSIRQPFSTGDLIDVAGKTGIVQNMNTRTTILLSPEGNHIQIPNATVFKSIINNFSAAAAQRNILSIGIGYDAPISQVQQLIMTVLEEHEAVITDPKPLVLVDSLGASTVNLNVYYWFDGARFGKLKVQSALLRLIKQVLTKNHISMPDDAREIIFPQGVPIVEHASVRPAQNLSKAAAEDSDDSMTAAEGNLVNEKADLEAHAGQAKLVEEQQNLLDGENKNQS